MLGDINAHAAIPVRNLDIAAKFYEEVLGLEDLGERDSGNALMFRTGETSIVLYESKFAGSNRGTSVLWEVDDPEALVEDLRDKGVEFEHYPDLPRSTLEGDLHRMGSIVAAWFKDPDGNILCIGNSL